MKKRDFVFTVGYSGTTANIDRRLYNAHARPDTETLLAAGLYKPAFCAALYDKDETAQARVLQAYNQVSPVKYPSIESLKRVFGVFAVPQNIARTNYL